MEQNIKNQQQLMVTIRCIAYNQEAYIRDCLEGFVMQKTNFRFEAIVHDDASTDGTATIIKEYAEKYPDIIKPILETENQYSKHDGSLRRIVDEACLGGKYVAWCEGDDYWIDPLKLQKQVDFLESNPDYSMCWTDAFEECNGERRPYHRYNKDCQSPLDDIIVRGGDFVPTCSIVMRKDVYFAMPKEARGFYCGDYPLQMWGAYSGKAYYLKKQTCVYRFMSIGSWTAKTAKESKTEMLRHYENEKVLLDSFNQLFRYKYNEAFERRKADILYRLLLSAGEYVKAKPYMRLRDKYGMRVGKSLRLKINGYPRLGMLLDICRNIFYSK